VITTIRQQQQHQQRAVSVLTLPWFAFSFEFYRNRAKEPRFSCVFSIILHHCRNRSVKRWSWIIKPCLNNDPNQCLGRSLMKPGLARESARMMIAEEREREKILARDTRTMHCSLSLSGIWITWRVSLRQLDIICVQAYTCAHTYI
jgi:hypothetical protein